MKLRQLADNLDGAGYQVPLATAETDTSATPSDQAAPPGDGLWQQFVGLFDRQDEPATEPPASAPVATVTDAPLTDFTITEDNRVITGTERAQRDPPCDTDKNSGPAKCGRRRRAFSTINCNLSEFAPTLHNDAVTMVLLRSRPFSNSWGEIRTFCSPVNDVVS